MIQLNRGLEIVAGICLENQDYSLVPKLCSFYSHIYYCLSVSLINMISFSPPDSSSGPPVEMIPTASIMDDLSKGNFVALSCRSIRVGSYKSMSKDKALFTHSGMHVKVPDIIDRKYC